MEIATLIIACLTLIIVVVGLFLNHKSQLNLTEQMDTMEEKLKQEQSNTKKDILDKINTVNDETIKANNSLDAEIKKTIAERIEQLKTEFKSDIEDVRKSINRNTDDFKETFESKSVKTKEEIQNTNTKLHKETTDSMESRLNIL